MEESGIRRPKQDDIRKWLVVVSGYITMVLDAGFLYSMGSMFNPIMDEFEASRAQAGTIQSTMFAVNMTSGLITGSFVKRFGLRTSGLVGGVLVTFGITTSFFATSVTFLVITLSGVSGVGISLLFISNTAAIAEHFEGRKKMIVVSVFVSGVSIGGMALPYILLYLTEEYGIRGTFLVMGAISANAIACCLLWNKPLTANAIACCLVWNTPIAAIIQVQSGEENHVNISYKPDHDDGEFAVVENPVTLTRFSKHRHSVDEYAEVGETLQMKFERAKDQNDSTINISVIDRVDKVNSPPKPVTALGSMKVLLKDKSFIAFAIAVALSNPTINMPIIFITDVFADKGYINADSLKGLFILNLVSIVGRTSPGLLMLIPGLPIMSIPLVGSFIGALAMVGVVLVPDLAGSLAMCAVIGLCLGSLVVMYVVAPVRLFEREHVPTAIGILFTSSGVVNIAIGPFSGMLRDLTKSYTIAFYSAAGCLMFACVMYFVAQVTHKQPKTQDTIDAIIDVTNI